MKEIWVLNFLRKRVIERSEICQFNIGEKIT